MSRKVTNLIDNPITIVTKLPHVWSEWVMARTKKMNESFTVSYNSREKNTDDSVKEISMSWENRDVEEIRNNLNIWIRAIDLPLEVVIKKT